MTLSSSRYSVVTKPESRVCSEMATSWLVTPARFACACCTATASFFDRAPQSPPMPHFGFMTLLGVISLAGIVINNAIVLLDRIRIEIEENGLAPQRAVVESAQRRLRPILLTTFTTLGGLLPLYLGGGPMWEPMAVAIMCGLVFATALTLGVVPVLYSLFFRVRYDGFTWDEG